MKMQVAVFLGGQSVEHEVSVITAMQVIAALDREKYDPVPVYITKDGNMYTGNGFDNLKNYRDIPSLLENGRTVTLARFGGRVILQAMQKRLFGAEKPLYIDVALPCVHGTFGEDGCLQGLFEMLGLPYVGSDVLAGAICADKPTAKTMLRAAGVPVLDDAVIHEHRFAQQSGTVLSALESRYPYPLIVKPVNLGSSIGITKVDTREKLAAALETAFCFAPRALIEPALIHRREINCAVIGDGAQARVSVCEEPLSQDAILSYRDKYQGGAKGASKFADVQLGRDTAGKSGMSGLARIIPAELPEDKTRIVQKLALETFSALGCSGVARIDFLWDTMHNEFYVNEVNTTPGSLAFYLWEASGTNFPAMLDELVELAYSRARRRSRLTFSYDSNILSV